MEEVKDQNELQASSKYPLKHTVVLVHFESPTEVFFCLSICQQNKKVLMTTYVFIMSAADSVGATFHDLNIESKAYRNQQVHYTIQLL
jgi:hypothetical protein